MPSFEPLLDRWHGGLLPDAAASRARLVVPAALRAFFIAGATHHASGPLLVVTPGEEDAASLGHDLAIYLGERAVAHFPAWETLPFEHISPSLETMAHRLEALWRLRYSPPPVTVASVRAAVQRLAPWHDGLEPRPILPGAEVDLDDLIRWLTAVGYRREIQVEARGEFALRGGILDVFAPQEDTPVRLELWGDEIDSVRAFSVEDQRSLDDVPGVLLTPARELLPTPEVRQRAEALLRTHPWGRAQWERLAQGSLFAGMESWLPWVQPDRATLLDRLPAHATLAVIDPKATLDRGEQLVREEQELAEALAETWGEGVHPEAQHEPLFLPAAEVLGGFRGPRWDLPGVAPGPDVPALLVKLWEPATADGEALAAQIAKLIRDGYSVTVAASTDTGADRLAERFRLAGLVLDRSPDPALDRPGGRVVEAPLESGFILADLRVGILTERDLFGKRRTFRARRRPRSHGEAVHSDLAIGDFVVHYHHGVGRFEGLVTQDMGGVTREYLLLAFAGDDRLYVPTDMLDAVRKYTGGEHPRLSRLGGSDWARTKARVRAEVAEIAEGLVRLYRTRLLAEGRQFSPDTPWQAELERAFPFAETPDQLRAIVDVKADMERAAAMDRLICGDVGFGKTEIAIRAAFKAVMDQTQVAVLVPTTILAAQHVQTFAERFASFPIRVEQLSRFLSPSEQRGVLAGLENGSVDVVIGTHRLLSDDVVFKNLGLLVVDEEQRFGVGAKERIKALKTNVDVLTLTATPIPRTLEMALTGIRDMSMILTPPEERQAVLTFVGPHDDQALQAAIRREMLREGQVFVVHHRIASLDEVVARLHELVPDARIAVAHGRMDESALEQVMIDFWEHRFDVLVSTTIIESGLDMPRVNTLIVDRAEMFGLSQLYQLRGRVGRARQRAYAYLFYDPHRALTEEAQRRLEAIGEFTDLGSGYRIAMRDLEIRGAGNLLGETQSGHIAAVGFDLYCQLVNEAVAELRGQRPVEKVEVRIDLPVDAHLPHAYIPGEELRLEAYQKVSRVRSDTDAEELAEEWRDRFGPPPPPAVALLDVARLRGDLLRYGITEIARHQRRQARIKPVRLSPRQAVRLTRLYRGSVYKEGVQTLLLAIPPEADPPAFVREALGVLLAEDDTPTAVDVRDATPNRTLHVPRRRVGG